MEKLKAGIIGLKGDGDGFLTALAGNDRFSVVAVYDADKNLAAEKAADFDCQGYDDRRQLIIAEDLDVLLLILPDYLCGECLGEAAKKKIHVLKAAPAGRELTECYQSIKMMAGQGAQYHICTFKRFAPGYRFANQLLTGKAIGRIYLARAQKFYNFPDSLDFRGDLKLSGGGVLLNDGMEMLDLITWNMGEPSQVYCQHSNFCAKRSLPPYLTEDTAAVLLDFPDGATASLQCSWMTGVQSENILFHGSEGSIQAGENYVKCYDVNGDLTEEENFDIDRQQLIQRQLEHFADGIIDPELPALSKAEAQLLNLAIVQSAYLSAKTRMPESLKRYDALM
ncbi:MAG: Gfo/Idh/MocA family oxidoreductase [Phycisphaerae bacterium]|nr:Gfo/Idh/MocA family oxidoreductase [Phycisphaerae bacterium]